MTSSQCIKVTSSNAFASFHGPTSDDDALNSTRTQLQFAVIQLQAMRTAGPEDGELSLLDELLAELGANRSVIVEAMKRFATRDLWRPFARQRQDLSKKERRLYKQACRRLSDCSALPKLSSLSGNDIRAYDRVYSVQARNHGEHDAELGRIGEMLTSAVAFCVDASDRHQLGRAVLALTMARLAADLRASRCTPELYGRMLSLFSEDWVLEATS